MTREPARSGDSTWPPVRLPTGHNGNFPWPWATWPALKIRQDQGFSGLTHRSTTSGTGPPSAALGVAGRPVVPSSECTDISSRLLSPSSGCAPKIPLVPLDLECLTIDSARHSPRWRADLLLTKLQGVPLKTSAFEFASTARRAYPAGFIGAGFAYSAATRPELLRWRVASELRGAQRIPPDVCPSVPTITESGERRTRRGPSGIA